MAAQRVIRLDATDAEVESPTRPWRVFIVDDHPMMREVIRLACENNPSLEVIGEAGTGSEALEAAAELAPDVLVLDMDLPDMSGVDVARYLRDRAIDCRVLVLTGSVDANLAFECLRLDVGGYIDKLTPFEQLPQIIEDVASGKRAVSTGAERTASQEFGHFLKQQREMSRTAAVLTDRERAVLEMIAEAMTSCQMARRLGLSERTIESHVAKLYKKLGVSNRAGALRKGAELGLVDDSRVVTDA